MIRQGYSGLTITRPTRITHTSATLIDNIYVKCDKYENIKSTIITTDISDHLPIITFIGKKCLTKSKTPLKLKYRPINSEILKQVATKINNINIISQMRQHMWVYVSL